ncbi:MAG: restriction endonuclease subunit S [Candidatus Auribacterota bacterium]
MKPVHDVPVDWEEVILGECVRLMKSGLSRLLSERDIGIPMLRSCNIGNRYPVFDNLKYWFVNDPQGANTSSYILKEGDLLVNFINSISQIGKACLYKNGIDRDCIYTTNILRLVPRKKVHGEYLFLVTQTDRYNWYVSTITKPAVNQASFTTKDLRKYLFPLPPLSEQKAIADLLSTWDEAIEKTERLIQAKEKRFKRLMNDLIYVPTKEGKWNQIKNKSLFRERKSTKRDDLPLLSITNGEGVIPREDTNRKDTSNEDKSKYLRICPGDIGYNTMRMWQGVSALSSLEGIVSPAYTICIPGEKLWPQFVAYLFKMPFMIHRFFRYSQGLTSDTWNLKFHHFSEVKMSLPSIEEQQQIAETLNIAQQEIDLLKQLVEKYKTQKRGLMQKMLTGEWRVKSEIVKQYEEA